MTPNQAKVIKALKEKGEPMTKRELIEATGIFYYASTDKHFGAILTRMVNAGLIHRPSRGVYQIGPDKNNPQDSNPNQRGLFDK
jgi:hypothetical protein